MSEAPEVKKLRPRKPVSRRQRCSRRSCLAEVGEQEQRASRRTPKEVDPDLWARPRVVFGWCCCLAANDST